MADVQLHEVWEVLEQDRDVLVVEAVASVDFEAEVVGLFGGKAEALQLVRAFAFAAEGFGERARVQFNEFGANACGGGDLIRIGRDKKADFDAGGGEFFARLGESDPMARGIKTALGGDLSAALGDHAHNVRLDIESDAEDFRDVRHLHVQSGLDRLAQEAEIDVLQMAAVLAQVGGNAVGAGGLANQRGFDRAGLAFVASPVTGFAQSGDMVDVDTQLHHSVNEMECRARSSSQPGAAGGG